MSIAFELEGMRLPGKRSGRDWHVTRKLKVDPDLTPGRFSVGYEVTRDDGLMGFMKASDVSMAFQTSDAVKALREIATSHEFERNILEHCQGNRLDKVVTALDSGDSQIEIGGRSEFIFYIIFELAERDLRKHAEHNHGTDLIWVLSAIHNLCVAMNQIHTINVYHNDFKPGNALIFRDTEKVADLGRATSPQFPAMHDMSLCAGDRRFAPPEQLYFEKNAANDIDRFMKAKAGDLYNLGSVIHFLITKRMITPEVILRLDQPFRPKTFYGGWTDSYESVLPYWRQMYNAVLAEFKDELPEPWLVHFDFALDEILDVIKHLCDPDFTLRGDLVKADISFNKYSLNKIISRIDSIRNRAVVKSRA